MSSRAKPHQRRTVYVEFAQFIQAPLCLRQAVLGEIATELEPSAESNRCAVANPYAIFRDVNPASQYPFADHGEP